MTSKSRKVIFLSTLVLFLISILFVIYKSAKSNEPDPQNIDNVSEQKLEESISIDFDGDGIKETVRVNATENNSVHMEAFNESGDKIAELWDGMPLYPTTLYEVINLNTKRPKQYLQWNMATGPHQVETVFLTIVDDKIHPIFSFDFDKKTMYSPFYTSRGGIVVEDANNDGLREIIENVDEYPVNAPRLEDPKLENMIREEFSKSGLSEEAIQSNIKIVSRENYGKGRGRKVIMAIHSFVDASTPFFRRLPQEEYEQIAGPLIAASIDIAKKQQENPNSNWEANSFMRYDDLEHDSKDFNNFVRDFWTFGRPFESPISEEQVN